VGDGPTVPITGATRLAGVIGHPVRHSRSPQIVNAAFAATGLDWVFTAFEVVEGDAARAVDAMRALGLGGLSVTMPHKQAVIASLDGLSDDAAALDAVNCIAWDGDALVGHNTDGPGLVGALAEDAGVAVAGRRCAVLGAGGAARAVVRALALAGSREVLVVNRTAARASSAAELAGTVGTVAEPRAVADVDIIINATSVGMGASNGAAGPMPIPEDLIGDHHTVVDLVYQPLQTPLLVAAQARGATVVDGLGMLVRQAALAVQLWTGVQPPLLPMAHAARLGE
jgi:shikimate dehydrogenase